MSKVHLKNGKAENMLAVKLWHLGYRYRKNYKKLPGSPDIALTRYKVAVFVDGEFWHGKDWEIRRRRLKRNREYWIEKIEENIARDNRIDKELAFLDWKVVHFWEKDVLKDLEGCAEQVVDIINEKKGMI